MRGARHGHQRAICVICGLPIREGEAVRGVALPGIALSDQAHLICYERDWESILSGLEPFPNRLTEVPEGG